MSKQIRDPFETYDYLAKLRDKWQAAGSPRWKDSDVESVLYWKWLAEWGLSDPKAIFFYKPNTDSVHATSLNRVCAICGRENDLSSPNNVRIRWDPLIHIDTMPIYHRQCWEDVRSDRFDLQDSSNE